VSRPILLVGGRVISTGLCRRMADGRSTDALPKRVHPHGAIEINPKSASCLACVSSVPLVPAGAIIGDRPEFSVTENAAFNAGLAKHCPGNGINSEARLICRTMRLIPRALQWRRNPFECVSLWYSFGRRCQHHQPGLFEKLENKHWSRITDYLERGLLVESV